MLPAHNSILIIITHYRWWQWICLLPVSKLIYSKEIFIKFTGRYVFHTRVTMPTANTNKMVGKRARQSFDHSQDKQARLLTSQSSSCPWSDQYRKCNFQLKLKGKHKLEVQNAFGKCSKTEQIQPPHYWLYQNSSTYILWVKTVIIGVDSYSLTEVCRNTKHEFIKMKRGTDFLFMICLWDNVKAEIVTDMSSEMFVLLLHIVFRHELQTCGPVGPHCCL